MELVAEVLIRISWLASVVFILYNWNDKRLKSIKNLNSSSTVAHP
nr:MAG TPA: hypothetical protein [Caudoviricetes sp.]